MGFLSEREIRSHELASPPGAGARPEDHVLTHPPTNGFFTAAVALYDPV